MADAKPQPVLCRNDRSLMAIAVLDSGEWHLICTNPKCGRELVTKAGDIADVHKMIHTGDTSVSVSPEQAKGGKLLGFLEKIGKGATGMGDQAFGGLAAKTKIDSGAAIPNIHQAVKPAVTPDDESVTELASQIAELKKAKRLKQLQAEIDELKKE